MQVVYEQIIRAAGTNASVVISGRSVTGRFRFFTSSAPVTDNSVDFPNGLLRNTDGSLQEAMDALEKHVILKALDQNRWHRGETADRLKIDRKTLLRKMKRYGIK